MECLNCEECGTLVSRLSNEGVCDECSEWEPVEYESRGFTDIDTEIKELRSGIQS